MSKIILNIWIFGAIEGNQTLSSYHQIVESCLRLSESRYIFPNGQEPLLLRHLTPSPPVHSTLTLSALTALTLQGQQQWEQSNPNYSNYISIILIILISPKVENYINYTTSNDITGTRLYQGNQ